MQGKKERSELFVIVLFVFTATIPALVAYSIGTGLLSKDIKSIDQKVKVIVVTPGPTVAPTIAPTATPSAVLNRSRTFKVPTVVPTK